MKSGLKQDTLAALRQAPLDLGTLFPDTVVKRADIHTFRDKGHSHGHFSGRRDNRFHPYKRSDRQSQEQKSGKPAWNNKLGHFSKNKGGPKSNKFSSCLARGQPSYK